MLDTAAIVAFAGVIGIAGFGFGRLYGRDKDLHAGHYFRGDVYVHRDRLRHQR